MCLWFIFQLPFPWLMLEVFPQCIYIERYLLCVPCLSFSSDSSGQCWIYCLSAQVVIFFQLLVLHLVKLMCHPTRVRTPWPFHLMMWVQPASSVLASCSFHGIIDLLYDATAWVLFKGLNLCVCVCACVSMVHACVSVYFVVKFFFVFCFNVVPVIFLLCLAMVVLVFGCLL